MCITIPSSANVKRSRRWGAWQWLAATPLRLFAFSGALSLFGGLMQTLFASWDMGGWPAYNLLFLVLPTLLLGPLFQFLPVLLRVTPLSYVKYASLFFVLLAAQLSFHGAALTGKAPGFVYLSLLALAWTLVSMFLRGMLAASYRSDLGWAWITFRLMPSMGAGGMLAGIALKAGWMTGLQAWIWVLVSSYLLLLLGLSLPGCKRASARFG